MKYVSKGWMAAALFLAASAVSAAESLRVSNAWIREAPANAMALGAFMVIHNPSATPRILVAARGNVAEKLELHKSVMENNVAKMIRQESIEVPANGEVKLQPGGLHVMLMGPKQALKAGDKVELTLEFKDGTKLPVSFEVRRAEGMVMNHDMGNMDHGSMNHGGMNHNH